MSSVRTRQLLAGLGAIAVVVVSACVFAGTALAAEGGKGTDGVPGTGVNGIPGNTQSTNGLVGASADGVNPGEPVTG